MTCSCRGTDGPPHVGVYNIRDASLTCASRMATREPITGACVDPGRGGHPGPKRARPGGV
jgi:hypothetical protein